MPSHRPRCLREVLQLTPIHRSAWNRLRLRWTRTSLDTPTTPRLLEPWQLLHALPTPRTRGQPPTSHHRGIPININRLNVPVSLPATLPLYPYEAGHRLSSLPHMPLRLQPAVLDNVSQLLLQTDAPDPNLTHRGYFGVRCAAASPTAAAFQSHAPLSESKAQTPLRRPSVQSSTPAGSSPAMIPKTLHRQPQTVALN